MINSLLTDTTPPHPVMSMRFIRDFRHDRVVASIKSLPFDIDAKSVEGHDIEAIPELVIEGYIIRGSIFSHAASRANRRFGVI